MLYKFKDGKLDKLDFYSFLELKGKEKDLEDLLAKHIKEIFIEDDQLMTIFQERQWKKEPDICAIDKYGNLILFELKRTMADKDTTIQILSYSQIFGQKTYLELNRMYSTYRKETRDLAEDHKETFGLDAPLKHEEFNKKQKLVIVGNSSDLDLIDSIKYWNSKGIDMEFIPYRFYRINEELYFEFFSKPYDYHINPRARKAVMFDTNRSYNENAIWDMFKDNKISAYGSSARYIDSLNKDDIVLYYHKGYGVISAGKIISNKTEINEKEDEKYKLVEFLVSKPINEDEIKFISYSEIREILNKNFFLASTIKTPYLTYKEGEKIIEELRMKYRD